LLDGRFDVGFIVLRKVVLYFWRKIEGGSWAGRKIAKRRR
jgi:hypothetical protein